MNVAIVGCGLIGKKRAKFAEWCGMDVLWVVDTNYASACDIHDYATPTDNLNNALDDPEVEIVIIATPHDSLYPIAKLALEKNKHVLIEKPAGISTSQIASLIEIANKNNLVVRVGYNHRYHPAISNAINRALAGHIGDILYVHGFYGHGGANLADEKFDWRLNPKISGGGDLLDKGSHLIDLAQQFVQGNFVDISGIVHNYYWNSLVEDNSFMTLENEKGQVAHLQTSCTEWNNKFYLSVTGTLGKFEINGLEESYGTESLTTIRRRDDNPKPKIEIEQFLDEDVSWGDEMADFIGDICAGDTSNDTLHDALRTMRIIQKIYLINKEEK